MICPILISLCRSQALSIVGVERGSWAVGVGYVGQGSSGGGASAFHILTLEEYRRFYANLISLNILRPI